jgi:hypothetical protein
LILLFVRSFEGETMEITLLYHSDWKGMGGPVYSKKIKLPCLPPEGSFLAIGDNGLPLKVYGKPSFIQEGEETVTEVKVRSFFPDSHQTLFQILPREGWVMGTQSKIPQNKSVILKKKQ